MLLLPFPHQSTATEAKPCTQLCCLAEEDEPVKRQPLHFILVYFSPEHPLLLPLHMVDEETRRQLAKQRGEAGRASKRARVAEAGGREGSPAISDMSAAAQAAQGMLQLMNAHLYD